MKVADNTGVARLWANVKTLLGGYVKTISYSGHTMTITKGDGTTSSFNTADNNTTYSVATQSANGLLSSTDKTKLDGIATGANKYTLPKATASALGGVKVGTNLSINSSGVLSATDTTYSNATTSVSGLMSADDKTKLNGIESEANKYVLPKATASALGGIKIGTNLSIDSNGVVSATDTKYSVATTSANGLLSSTDKATINSLVEATEAEISALE